MQHETIRLTINQARHHEATQATRARRSILDACRDEKLLRVGHGAKPLLARDQIGAVILRSRDRRICANITAALHPLLWNCVNLCSGA